jgi:hypothetical protein
MNKSFHTQKASTTQPLELDVVCHSSTQTENEKSKNSELKEVLTVALLILDSLVVNIGSQDRIFLALCPVKDAVKNDPIKKKILKKLEIYLEKRRNDNIFVKTGFF